MDKLWYKKPASIWQQALPIGNGHTGVMIYGGKRKEKLSFNDGTLWSGYPKDQTNPDSLKFLNKVRELIFAGKNSEALTMTEEKLCGAYSEAFMPLGDLKLKFSNKFFKGYKRELDLSNAIHTISFGKTKRETFASYPNQVVAYRVTGKWRFSMKLTAGSKLRSAVMIDNALNLLGNAPDYVAPNYLRKETKPVRYDEGKGMSFCLRVEVVSDGKIIYRKRSIKIRRAKAVTLFITTATGFAGYDKMPETGREAPLRQCKETLLKLNREYAVLRARHLADYRAIYGRQKLSLSENDDSPTADLVKLAKEGEVKTALVELFYNYGKYMTIAGSRKGGQALNLQGIWNKSVRPPWSSNYTTNINAQMNYWGTTAANLAECMEPYINLVYEIMLAGRKTAAINYGCKGFACNHNVDIWRKTAPVQGAPAYMYAPLCGAWLGNEIYEHYLNGGLELYKDKIYEVVKETAAFLNDYLIEHDGFFVTCPSASPEADFISGGKQCNLDYASTFEMSVAGQAIDNYLSIMPDGELAAQLNTKLEKLYPFQEGSTGILEWHKDYPIVEKGHRHFSPLYGFYPGRVIKYYENREETGWVKKLLEYRMANSGQHIGWSAAWAICLAGRLHDGEKAMEVINGTLSHAVFMNLFGVHPPLLFQIDGNFGFIAGINEMLAYTENGIIELLPALPEKWHNGEVKGMMVRGAEISFCWSDGKVTSIASSKPIKVMKTAAVAGCKVGGNVELVEV
jgi:alpha-L-fucosidase 2